MNRAARNAFYADYTCREKIFIQGLGSNGRNRENGARTLSLRVSLARPVLSCATCYASSKSPIMTM